MIGASPHTVKRWTVVMLAGGVLAACGNASAQQLSTSGAQAAVARSAPGQAQPNPGQNASAVGPQLVRAVNFSFQPPSLSVPAGAVVMFRNDDGESHTFSADGGAFDSGVLAGGQSFTFTFNTAGTFAYHCNIHSSMRGTIAVGGAAAAGTPAQGPGVTGLQPSADPESEAEVERHGGEHGGD
jgi:plastocyanin